MAETLSKELVVVGGGVAGCTAALYAQRYNLDLILLEKAAPGGLAATASHIENYPGFPEGVSGLELAMRVHQQAVNAGVEVVTGTAEAVRRDGDAWIIQTPNGDIRTLSIIIATGASPRRLKIPGERELFGMGVSYCATCDGNFYRNQDVAVVGGGNTAVDEAIYLSDICRQVYLVHRRDQLRAEQVLQDRAFARANLEIVWDSVPVEVLGVGGEVGGLLVRNVKTEATRNLAVTGVFVAIGHEPQTDWVRNTVELRDGFVVTDMNMSTGVEGIFAAGDIRETPLRQVTTAVGDASIAAFSAWQYIMSRRG